MGSLGSATIQGTMITEPAVMPTWLDLGRSMAARGRLQQALLCFEAAQESDPQSAEPLAERGLVLFKLNRPAEAMAAYTAALTLAPDHSDTWLNLGVLYQVHGHFDEARSCFETVLARRPRFVIGWSNLAKMHRALGDIEAALTCFREALRWAPDDPTIALDCAMCQLMLGDFVGGWQGYEARFQINAEPKILPGRFPLWRGEPLDGRRLLVMTEQGFGDTFQFVRFVAALAGLGAAVTLRAPVRLLPVLSGLSVSCRLVDDIGAEERFDFEAPLMSLPLFLMPEAIMPPDPPRYLGSEAARAARWASRLTDAAASLKIGIAWQGNPAFVDDINRSVPLSAFAGLAALPGVRLISLQVAVGLQQLQEAGVAVEQLGAIDVDGAFIDTAAIIDGLDLVITSDTAVAHLAGALGRPVWLALAKVPDWRWGMAGDTTPWYPAMRLFRQTDAGDWNAVFARIGAALVTEYGLPAV